MWDCRWHCLWRPKSGLRDRRLGIPSRGLPLYQGSLIHVLPSRGGFQSYRHLSNSNWDSIETLLNIQSPRTYNLLSGRTGPTEVPACPSRPSAPLRLSRTVMEYGLLRKGERTGPSQPQLSQLQGTGQNEICAGTNHLTPNSKACGSLLSTSRPLSSGTISVTTAGWPLSRMSLRPPRIFSYPR